MTTPKDLGQDIWSVKIMDMMQDPLFVTTETFQLGGNNNLCIQLRDIAKYGLVYGYILTCVYHNTCVFTNKNVFNQIGE